MKMTTIRGDDNHDDDEDDDEEDDDEDDDKTKTRNKFCLIRPREIFSDKTEDTCLSILS